MAKKSPYFYRISQMWGGERGNESKRNFLKDDFQFLTEKPRLCFCGYLIAMKSYEFSPLNNVDPGTSDVCRNRRARAGIAGACYSPVREPEEKAQGDRTNLTHVNHSCP